MQRCTRWCITKDGWHQAEKTDSFMRWDVSGPPCLVGSHPHPRLCAASPKTSTVSCGRAAMTAWSDGLNR